jgi:hypothetical protein
MKTDEPRRLTRIRVDEASEAIRKTESPTASATVSEAAHEIAATAAVVGMLAIVAAGVAAEAVAASAIPSTATLTPSVRRLTDKAVPRLQSRSTLTPRTYSSSFPISTHGRVRMARTTRSGDDLR